MHACEKDNLVVKYIPRYLERERERERERVSANQTDEIAQNVTSGDPASDLASVGLWQRLCERHSLNVVIVSHSASRGREQSRQVVRFQ